MNAIELRLWCLQQPAAVEEFPFGPEHSVFRVAGKMFALSALDRTPLEVSVKCEPELAAQLRNTYAVIRPGYHLNKRHWNTITLDGSPSGPARARSDRGLVRPRRQRPPEAHPRAARHPPSDAVHVKRVRVSRGAIPPGRSPRRTSREGTGASRRTASREDPSPSSRQRSDSPTTTTPAERATRRTPSVPGATSSGSVGTDATR